MNTYRVTYIMGMGVHGKHAALIKADTVNGLKNGDVYIFKIGEEVVAVVPKSNVALIQKVIQTGSDDV